MNYRKQTIRELEEYNYLLSAVENCKNRIVELEEKMVRLRSVRTDEETVRSSRKEEDRLCMLLDEKQKEIWNYQSIHMKISRFDRAMRAISDEDRTVLQACFLHQNNTPEDAAWELGVEKSSLYKKRNRALAHFTKALFGVTEED